MLQVVVYLVCYLVFIESEGMNARPNPNMLSITSVKDQKQEL